MRSWRETSKQKGHSLARGAEKAGQMRGSRLTLIQTSHVTQSTCSHMNRCGHTSAADGGEEGAGARSALLGEAGQ